MGNSNVQRQSLGAPMLVRSMFGIIAFLALFAVLNGAFAVELGQAKADKVVGEQANGYLGIPNPPGSAEVQRLVAETNLRRREKYAGIASQNGASLEAVEALAGKALIGRAKSGEMVRNSADQWIVVQ